MKIVVFDSNLPVKSFRLMLTFPAPTGATSEGDASVNFTMKYGLIGKLMKRAARKEFRDEITRLLQSKKVLNEAA